MSAPTGYSTRRSSYAAIVAGSGTTAAAEPAASAASAAPAGRSGRSGRAAPRTTVAVHVPPAPSARKRKAVAVASSEEEGSTAVEGNSDVEDQHNNRSSSVEILSSPPARTPATTIQTHASSSRGSSAHTNAPKKSKSATQRKRQRTSRVEVESDNDADADSDSSPTIAVANRVRKAKGKAPQRAAPLIESPPTTAAPSRPRPRPRRLPTIPTPSGSSSSSIPDPLDLFSNPAASTALHEDLRIDPLWLSSPGLPPVSHIMRNHSRGPAAALPTQPSLPAPPPYTSSPFPGPSLSPAAPLPPAITGSILAPASSTQFPYPGLDSMATPLRNLPSLPTIPSPPPHVVIPLGIPTDQMIPFVSYPWKRPAVSGYDVYMKEEDFEKLMSPLNYNCFLQFHNFILSGNYCNMGKIPPGTLTMNGKTFISLPPYHSLLCTRRQWLHS
ncbi:hypothetical protein BDN72DRAFT_905620 [Pluteus cervinus]|uniref:Uncharacterized protein n=1 Tax=Pluteus cervinus TaxID=181527 RepID=A0ACD3A1K6_9AGAR|nr:hypothetical protein BDN72DRAFT_905620 [Pluteus cervinus]